MAILECPGLVTFALTIWLACTGTNSQLVAPSIAEGVATATSIAIDLTPGEPVTEYCVTYNAVVELSQPWAIGTAITLCKATSPVTVTGLQEATQYSFAGFVKDPLQQSPVSSSLPVATLEAAPSSAPTNLNFSSVTTDSVILNWGIVPRVDQNGVITQYRISYTDLAAGGKAMSGISATTSFTAASLTSFTNYSFSVFAVNSQGDSPPLTGTIVTAQATVNCGSSLRLLHGLISYPRSTVYKSRANLTCLQGYHLHGNASVTCLANGQWTVPGDCVADAVADCGSDLQLPNGVISYPSQTLYQSTANLSCDSGYRLRGNSTISCLAGGQWTSTGQCLPVNCGSSIKIVNGFMSYPTQTVYQAIANLSCNPGYRPSGNASVTCRASGQWSVLVECQLVNPSTRVTLPSVSSSVIFFSEGDGPSGTTSTARTAFSPVVNPSARVTSTSTSSSVIFISEGVGPSSGASTTRTKNTGSSSSGDGKAIEIGGAVGIFVGGFLIASAVGLLIRWLRRQQRRRAKFTTATSWNGSAPKPRTHREQLRMRPLPNPKRDEGDYLKPIDLFDAEYQAITQEESPYFVSPLRQSTGGDRNPGAEDPELARTRQSVLPGIQLYGLELEDCTPERVYVKWRPISVPLLSKNGADGHS